MVYQGVSLTFVYKDFSVDHRKFFPPSKLKISENYHPKLFLGHFYVMINLSSETISLLDEVAKRLKDPVSKKGMDLKRKTPVNTLENQKTNQKLNE